MEEITARQTKGSQYEINMQSTYELGKKVICFSLLAIKCITAAREMILPFDLLFVKLAGYWGMVRLWQPNSVFNESVLA